MLGLGPAEILFVALVIIVVVGPDRLPRFMRTAGRLYGQLRRAADEMRRSLVLEADRQDANERYEELRRRRAAAKEDVEKARQATGPGVVPQQPEQPPAATAESEEHADDIGAKVERARAFREGELKGGTAGALPSGVSADEWDALPQHIRDLLASKDAEGEGS